MASIAMVVGVFLQFDHLMIMGGTGKQVGAVRVKPA